MSPYAAEISTADVARPLQAKREKPLGLLTPAEYRAQSAAHDACRWANDARINPLVAQIKRARGLL